MTGPDPRNHEIDWTTAQKLRDDHRQDVTQRGTRGLDEGALGSSFAKDAVTKLLSNPAAAYLRCYYGRNAQGGRELLLVAADKDGNDITTMTLDQHFPCPPFC
jgi:hypothetical protein